MFKSAIESIADMKKDLNVKGTAHSSAVTNLCDFNDIIQSICNMDNEVKAKGTAHSSSVTNLDII